MDVKSISDISFNFATWLSPILVVGITFVTVMMLRDSLTSIAKGMKFRFDPTFKEGDVVFIEGERAIIVKLGMMKTVFGVTKDDGTYCWRYIPNTRIEYLKLEKIINLDNLLKGDKRQPLD